MSPTFCRVEWIHDSEGGPFHYYYDHDNERYATRKIELSTDGRAGAYRPAPPPGETNALEEFRTQERIYQEFEEALGAASGDR